MGGPFQTDSHALELLQLLPGAELTRTRDVIQLDEPDRRGIVALVTPEALELRMPTIEWQGPHTPVLGSKLWRRVEWRTLKKGDLARLVAAARRARARQFRRCTHCGELFEPGHMHDAHTCQGCAERYLGVVH
jgi:hypothetical protein